MENIKLSDNLSQERKDSIKDLWKRFKEETTNEEKDSIKDELENLINDWKEYKAKIKNGTLSLDDYTNRVGNSTATMPGSYLCHFLETTTKEVLGFSRPGTAENFGVKLNADKTTYYVKKSGNKPEQKNAGKAEATEYFEENIKGLLEKIVSESDPSKKIKLINDTDYSAKQILMKIAVLENLKDILQIYKSETIEELYNEFINEDDDGKKSVYEKNLEICKVAKKLLEVKEDEEDDEIELILLSRFLWHFANTQAIVDANNPNVILYGPPGTGKTFSVKNSLDFICKGDTSQYEILQFHPSFTYEDFIEGIKPKGVSKDGNIRFELVNGIFKNFCIKAKSRPKDDFYFVVDEINRANLSSVFGETLSLLEKDYRDDGSGKHLIKTQYSALIEQLIEENPDDNEYEKLAYYYGSDSDSDAKQVKFGIPKNVYFIGMMNDVDKSIDAFDLALRRRFKWIRKDCDYEVIEEETRFKGKDDFDNIAQYVKACKKLNEYISKDLALGKSYEFGHSFFMKISDIAKRKKITQKNIETLFDLYLRPTLKEYLRAVFAENELDSKLDEALSKLKEL